MSKYQQTILIYELDSTYGNQVISNDPYITYKSTHLVKFKTKSKTYNRSEIVFNSVDLPLPSKGLICILDQDEASQFDIENYDVEKIICSKYVLPSTIEEKNNYTNHKILINTVTDPVYFKLILVPGKCDGAHRDDIGNYYIYVLHKIYIYHKKGLK